MRDIDVKNYVPPFLLEYEELKQIYETENREFKRLDDASDKLLDNQFIKTADEYGVARYERMYKIKNTEGYTLEERRLKVLMKQMDDIPYTRNTLKERLDRICGAGNYNFEIKYNEHLFLITTHLTYQAQLEVLENMIKTILPAAMVSIITNSFDDILQTEFFYVGGAVVSTDCIELTE